MDINELEYEANKGIYFKSKEDLIRSVQNSKEYYEDQVKFYEKQLEIKKNMLTKIENFLKCYNN